jgi:hypothetical protein
LNGSLPKICPGVQPFDQDGPDSRFRGEDFFLISPPPFFLFLGWWPSWLEVGITGQNLEGAIQGPFHQSLVAIGPVVYGEYCPSQYIILHSQACAI